ncbi:hypothetical protein [Rugosimonospora africana]|uniref:Uncharacterized protein n=1 Tax=Rugosimonospora africana TaxID=556532 RepID=A0A8J3QTE0_9ACTN|nr:hypothetical protein [Rugosimonospora africana]GIH16139.1 hypothetical protein Raf01_43110 [Rugosimonospora africana]
MDDPEVLSRPAGPAHRRREADQCTGIAARFADATMSTEPGFGRLLAVDVHGETWSVILRPDRVVSGREEPNRTANTRRFSDGFQDEDGQPLSFCPDGEDDVDWAQLVHDVLTLIDPHPLVGTRTWPRRRGGHRPRQHPGPDPRTVHSTDAPPNRAGQAP